MADNNDPSYETLNEALIPYLPPDFSFDKVYLSLYDNVDAATQDIISNMNQGVMIVNYVGHGSAINWAGEMIFESSDIPALTNETHLPLIISMTCMNGYFAQPFSYCLAEEFLAAKNTGAIACFSSSGLTSHWVHEILNKEVFSNVFDQENNTLGYITIQAKIAAYAKGATEEMMKIFTLFGDPAGRFGE